MQNPESSFQGQEEYSFKHVMLHKTLYESIHKKHRPVYHRWVARWIEEHLHAERADYCGMLALHYDKAGERTHAATWYRRALEQSSRFEDLA